MTAKDPNIDLRFLSGSGEMSALIRAKDWSKTPVGDPHTWPQSLRTTLGIVLNSKFPMFLWWGPELTCFYNDAYRPSLGTNGKHPSILGQPAAEAWTEIWSIIKPRIDEVLSGGEATWSEDQLIPIYRNSKIEDAYRTFSYSPVNDESGKVAGVLVIYNQKTFASELERQVRERTKELEQANASLKKSEERYHLMVEEVQDYAILYLDQSGMVENWNQGAEKIKGYRADEIIGKNFSAFYTETDRQNNLPQTLLEQARTSGKAVQEGWRVRKDKTLFWASVVITAVHDEKNNVIGFSKVTHDLTDKKKADDTLKMNAEQLAQKNAELEKMNIELQSFAYVSSHDLQEPLRKIQTFASRIISKEAGHLSDTGKDYFMRMQQAASRMQTLIQDLLAYSRTSTDDLVFEDTDLTDIVMEVKNDVKEVLAEKNAVIEMGEMCRAHIIPFQFRQLLHNLIGNALKFSKKDVPPHITIHSEKIKGDKIKVGALPPGKNYCHISVSDNGIGFDPQYSERIFVVFQRLHGKEQFSGTGIGLAIVKKIVENHHGVITATSELNKGARFDIFIPS
jgi:PAS domain S-box-containing protein